MSEKTKPKKIEVEVKQIVDGKIDSTIKGDLGLGLVRTGEDVIECFWTGQTNPLELLAYMLKFMENFLTNLKKDALNKGVPEDQVAIVIQEKIKEVSDQMGDVGFYVLKEIMDKEKEIIENFKRKYSETGQQH